MSEPKVIFKKKKKLKDVPLATVAAVGIGLLIPVIATGFLWTDTILPKIEKARGLDPKDQN